MPIEFDRKVYESPSEALLAIVQVAIAHDASDIYLKAGAPPHFRMGGITQSLCPGRLEAPDTEAVAKCIMTPDQFVDFRRNWEINLALPFPGLGRFRVNAYRQRDSIAMVLRRIRTDIPDLENLGLPKRVQELALLKNGLVVVVGATGSGKSTTLAAMIGLRSRMLPGHIVTVEDPLEFLHRDQKSIVSQREIGSDTESFAAALKNALRQAPDVILIGEIRDRESLDAALAFAETGHLVLTSLHSTNAAQTIERMLQFFPADQHGQLYPNLANNLRGIVAQRLVPRADAGGRVPAVELLIATPLIRDFLRREDTHLLRKAMAAAKLEGMQTFDQSLYDLYDTGVITLETALAYADSANDLRLRSRGLSN